MQINLIKVICFEIFKSTPIMLFNCFLLQFFACLYFCHNTEGSCEFPFHPLQNPNDPEAFLYCKSQNDAETCPNQSSCEDLWLGLYVCCGYGSASSRPTVERMQIGINASSSGRKLLRVFVQNADSFLRNNKSDYDFELDDSTRNSTEKPKFILQAAGTVSSTVPYSTAGSLTVSSKNRTTRNITVTSANDDVMKKANTAVHTNTAVTSSAFWTTMNHAPKTTQTSTVATLVEKFSTTKNAKIEKIAAGNKRRSVNPEVFILQEGKSRKINATSYRFPSSITLIIDHGKSVIVDTGLPTDYEILGLFLTELHRYGVEADSVDVVVTTHGHPDHFGHLNLFPSAIQIFGGLIYIGNTFSVSDLYINEISKLTENISVYKTPGHTAEDLTVLIRNVTDLGNVAVVGDLFFSKDDINHPELWESQSWNVSMQDEYRRLILCRVDYIVPGHGSMYKVEAYMRRRFDCK